MKAKSGGGSVGGDWLDFFFGNVGCVLSGLRWDWYAMSVYRRSNRLRGCVRD